MLAEGELDALMHPDLIKPLINKDPRVARLFPNYKQEEVAYYQKTGIFPIMHFVAIRQEFVDKHPWIPMNMFQAFNDAKSIAMERMGKIRGSCRSRGIAKVGKSSRNFLVPIHGSTA